MRDEFGQKIQSAEKPWVKEHLNRQIPPESHTPMYLWHKYWSRKTWNVVGKFVETYAPTGSIVFDPFAGSGVTAIEAVRRGRRAIAADLSPVATEIIRLTIKPVSLLKLQEAYKRVEQRAKKKILSLYQTQCRRCGFQFPFTCAVWHQSRKNTDHPIKRKCLEIRYPVCPQCGDRREKKTPPKRADLDLINLIDREGIKEWYPQNRLYYPNGRPFMKKEKFESLDELFTKRNLKALAILMAAIEEETNKDLRDFLKIAFSSTVHLCTVMCPIRPTRPFSSAWTEHSYWFAPKFMEQNVWQKFESAVIDKQGLLAAKKESNQYFEKVKIGQNYQEVISGQADLYIHTGDSGELMKKIAQDHNEKGAVDYIFTDPPYDSSVQYGELTYLWAAWLKKDQDYLEKIATHEIIHNERQKKDFETYHHLLTGAFKHMFNVLKPNHYLTVTFHNPTFKVRNATIRAGVFAGFELEKIHHQELARSSAKSLLQPFGSAQGDFYLRFHKNTWHQKTATPESIDEIRFEKVIVETAIKTITERGEETPYTLIINAVDPELAQNGFFSELQTGLDVKTVLEKHLGQEFILTETKLGGAIGKLWWLKNPAMVPHLESTPLTERVEKLVLLKLQERGKVGFTEIWDAISREFPNSLTADTMSIVDALKAYARPQSRGWWLIKPNLRPSEIEKEHTLMIVMLAQIGKNRGYQIWVGKNEQSHPIRSFPNLTGELRQFLTIKTIDSLLEIQNSDIVADIDLLWIKKNKVVAAFEIESTTSMTSGLQRGSNLVKGTAKYLVMPEEREAQFLRKLRSPMFADRFRNDNWQILYFKRLKEEYGRHKSNTEIEKLINQKTISEVEKRSTNSSPQLLLGLF